MYKKDFDLWCGIKKEINSKDNKAFIRKGEIRWVSIGINIGSEIDGKGDSFTRPCLILHTIGNILCLIIPCTSKDKSDDKNFIKIESGNYSGFLNLTQIRIVSQKRILTRIAKVSNQKLKEIKSYTKNIFELSSEDKDLHSYVGTKAIIQNSNREILVIQEAHSNKWELPGGKIQKNETSLSREECLLREIKEELGIDFKIKIGHIFDTTFRVFTRPRNPDIKNVFLVVYLCEYIDGKISKQDEEVSDSRWVNKSNYEQVEYVNGYKKVIDKFFSNQT